MKNRIRGRFARMNYRAFSLLMICFNIILFSLCAFYIYLDTAKPTEIFALIYYRREIVTLYTSSLLLSLGGAFLLDYTYARKE